MSATTTPPVEPVLLKVEAAMHALSMSRSVIYELIRAGRLRSVNEGRARFITRSAINEYIALLEREAGVSK
ncbi:helix-turn-helix domain-containing protein [Streptomyces sp. ISL-66]|uniref:helix-turn-helix domain-containing protein n=1 Tax=Streptomyces sp. ISL-66 TaxID=2819186 RepID=UPI0027E4B942|nr:helix-turn-helix domain-containing protein [Streptomyces sp. ISL-66]